jgi:regulator of protease activity HflC (stomatin/prohibitin superfamily)
MWFVTLLFILFLYFIVTRLFIIVEMREEVIQERLGKFKKILKPGFHFMIPFVDRAAYHQEMREQVIDVPGQTCITKDNIEVIVDGIAYIKVMDSYKASYGISNYKAASINLAQTTMRSEIGKITLDDTFSEREAMNENIVREIDKAAGPWGVKVMRYEIKNIRPSNEIVDTMEKQMEAERQKRADITNSEGFRESRINESQGEKQSQVLISEAERQRRINEAKGRAKEIELVATATANGIKRVASAVARPGGELAVKTKLVEQYIDQFGKIIKSSNVSVLPVETANLKTFFEGAAAISDNVGGKTVENRKKIKSGE